MLSSISGPSCAGKSLLLRRLHKHYESKGLPCKALESITTRPPRPHGEGADNYRFVSEQEFGRLVEAGELAWHRAPHGQPYRYGTRKEALIEAIKSRALYISILTVDVIEILHAMAEDIGYSNNVQSIYLAIADEAELRRRFTQDNRSDVEARMDYMKINTQARQVMVPMYWLKATLPPDRVLSDTVYILNNFLPR